MNIKNFLKKDKLIQIFTGFFFVLGILSFIFMILDLSFGFGNYVFDTIDEVIRDKDYSINFEKRVANNNDSNITNYVYNKCKRYDDKDYVLCINQEIEKKFVYKSRQTPLKEINETWVGNCDGHSVYGSTLLNKKNIYYSKIILRRHIYLIIYLKDEICSFDINELSCDDY